jgi:hypothetical protein
MNQNVLRNGNFTSSEIVALTAMGNAPGSIGKPFYTYVEECNMERRLGRSLTKDSNARATSWGNLGEKRVFDILPTTYQLFGDTTLIHPQVDCWVGSPDVTREQHWKKIVGDVKCPYTLDSFCSLVDPHMKYGRVMYNALTIEAVRANNPKEGEKYYWQLVSNAILTDSDEGELIVYCPYLDELGEMRTLASVAPVEEMYLYYWVVNALDVELPYLVRHGGRHDPS